MMNWMSSRWCLQRMRRESRRHYAFRFCAQWEFRHLRHSQDDSFDIVLSDINMPESWTSDSS